MNTPSITPAQIAAGVQALLAAVAGVLLAFLGNFDDTQKAAVLGIFNATGVVLGIVILYVDAVIRGKRAENADKISEAVKALPAKPAPKKKPAK